MLLVIVPAFNEEDSIADVVQDARSVLGADVVVIDDGSSDETANRALRAGATVLSHPFNLGVGGAIRTAMRYAFDNAYEQVVQMDGDGQHEAAEAKTLVEALDRDEVDLVVGSRFAAGYDVSGVRRIPMKLLSRLVSRRIGHRVSDTTSGFRAMGPRAIATFAAEYPVEYLSDTVEALLLAHDAGLRIGEQDVRMRARQGGTPSATSFKSVYHLVRLSLVVVLYSIRRRPSPSQREVI